MGGAGGALMRKGQLIATIFYNITSLNSQHQTLIPSPLKKVLLMHQKKARNQITSKLVSSSHPSFKKCFYIGIFSHRQARVVDIIQRYAFLQKPVQGRQMPTLRSPARPNW
jgi:hypothetical protein